MRKKIWIAGLLVATLAAGACTSFETSRETLSPASPSPIPGGSSSGTLIGTWADQQVLTQQTGVPSPSTCTNFQWEITSQSDTAIAGSFSASCGGGVSISATVTGVLNNPTTVTINVTGTGIVNGLGCPFSLNGIGTITDNYTAITIPYTGTTCFGPVSGTETLRKPSPATPTAPEPTNPEPDPQPENPHHVGPGPLSGQRAEQIVYATGDEFPYLLAATNESEKVARAEELLLRVIWHLQLAGFESARQKNPSGAISNDKLTVVLDDGRWHAFDIMTNFDIGGLATRLIWFEVGGPNPQPNGGIPD